MTDIFSQSVDILMDEFDPLFEEYTQVLTSTKYNVNHQSVVTQKIQEEVSAPAPNDRPVLNLSSNTRARSHQLNESVITEDQVVTPLQSSFGMMDDLSNKLSTYLNRTNNVHTEEDPTDINYIVENLSKQIQDVRRLVLENTVVSGIGQGGDGQGPGSGEVWFKYLNDINIDGVQDGDTIIWDGNLGQWVPGTPSVQPTPPTETCNFIDGGNTSTAVYESYMDGGSLSDAYDNLVSGGDASGTVCDNDIRLEDVYLSVEVLRERIANLETTTYGAPVSIEIES